MDRLGIAGYESKEFSEYYAKPPLSSAEKLKKDRENLEAEKQELAAKRRRIGVGSYIEGWSEWVG